MSDVGVLGAGDVGTVMSSDLLMVTLVQHSQ